MSAGSSDLIIDEVNLVQRQPMSAPVNMVYSTGPEFGTDSSGRTYCIKGGDDVGVVLSELVGHVLAGMMGVPVPEFAVGRFSGAQERYFCSCIVDDALRDIGFHLKKDMVSDLTVLAKIILLDVWLANDDRNIGNILGRPSEDRSEGRIDLVAIDFEKSRVVRSRAPLVEIPLLAPGKMWPTGELGAYAKGRAKLTKDLVNSVRSVSTDQLERAVTKSLAALRVNDEPRCAIVVDALVKRQSNIENLARHEWN